MIVLIEFLGGGTFLPGTAILTGTPQDSGVAAKPPRWLKPGYLVTIEVDRIGERTKPIVLEK